MSTPKHPPLHRVRKLLRFMQKHEDELDYYGLALDAEGKDYTLVSATALHHSHGLTKYIEGKESKSIRQDKVGNKPVHVYNVQPVLPYVEKLDLAGMVACLYGIKFEIMDFYDAPVPVIYNVYNYSNKWQSNFLPHINEVIRARLYYFDALKSLDFLQDMYDFERQPDINKEIAHAMLETAEVFITENFGKNSPNFEELSPELQDRVQDLKVVERKNEVKEEMLRQEQQESLKKEREKERENRNSSAVKHAEPTSHSIEESTPRSISTGSSAVPSRPSRPEPAQAIPSGQAKPLQPTS